MQDIKTPAQSTRALSKISKGLAGTVLPTIPMAPSFFHQLASGGPRWLKAQAPASPKTPEGGFGRMTKGRRVSRKAPWQVQKVAWNLKMGSFRRIIVYKGHSFRFHISVAACSGSFKGSSVRAVTELLFMNPTTVHPQCSWTAMELLPTGDPTAVHP